MYDVKSTTSKRSTDCGACCMVSFLDFYGEEITLEQAIEECNVKISGSSAGDLSKCGKEHGLDMRVWAENWAGFKGDASEDVTDAEVYDLDRPAICWWKRNHWIICCGRDETGKVIIMNPSRGRYGLRESMFKMLYSGVFITDGVPKTVE